MTAVDAKREANLTLAAAGYATPLPSAGSVGHQRGTMRLRDALLASGDAGVSLLAEDAVGLLTKFLGVDELPATVAAAAEQTFAMLKPGTERSVGAQAVALFILETAFHKFVGGAGDVPSAKLRSQNPEVRRELELNAWHRFEAKKSLRAAGLV